MPALAPHARLNPGVLLTLSANPQCSHSIHIRDWSHFQFHVSFPHCGHVSGRGGFGASHGDVDSAAITPKGGPGAG